MAQRWHRSLHSTSPPRRDFVGVEYCDQVDDARCGDKSGAVVASGTRYIRTGAFQYSGQQVKYSGSSIRPETQCSEWIGRSRREHVSPRLDADCREPSYCHEKYDRSHGAAEKKMTESGDKPRRQGDRKRADGRNLRGEWCGGFGFVEFRLRNRVVVRSFVGRFVQ